MDKTEVAKKMIALALEYMSDELAKKHDVPAEIGNVMAHGWDAYCDHIGLKPLLTQPGGKEATFLIYEGFIAGFMLGRNSDKISAAAKEAEANAKASEQVSKAK